MSDNLLVLSDYEPKMLRYLIYWQEKAENCYIWEAGPKEPLAFWLKK